MKILWDLLSNDLNRCGVAPESPSRFRSPIPSLRLKTLEIRNEFCVSHRNFEISFEVLELIRWQKMIGLTIFQHVPVFINIS